MHLIFTLMSFRDVPDKYTLNLFLSSRGAEDVSDRTKLAINLQMQILGLFWDRLFRCKDIDRIRGIMLEYPGMSAAF